ncbi:MAG: cob(I)yrinic acid a,c-diamide adenosyltransferase [Candidatus Paceibacterota bacterium]
MTFFTGKGDDGTTKTFGCNQRISKSSAIAEALGTVDELNSFLGLLKVKGSESNVLVPKTEETLASLIHAIQHDLFIVQAELAGADKAIEEEKVVKLEKIINTIERSLPEITTFFVSGGTELAALCDVARTITRRAERRVIAVYDGSTDSPQAKGQKVDAQTLAYLNRLSSIFYALARLVNHQAGVSEESPTYV